MEQGEFIIGDKYRKPENRIGGIALLDTLLTLLFSIIAVLIIDKKLSIKVFLLFIILMLTSIGVHKLFDVKTMLLYNLCLSDKPDVVKFYEKKNI